MDTRCKGRFTLRDNRSNPRRSLELYDDATNTRNHTVKKVQWFDEQSDVGANRGFYLCVATTQIISSR